ncbi:hypothetical protein [Zunongwangia sp. HGR-M22]|uniref:hypothetical protein n=1 Tax=Zunongwangia sp. HGR-M22 TaxID=3015168 RepID=UPI0022DD5DEB|nr:hypothetical protein [Zunongwangia sp. HGR-M22]WBL24233.1 hypothetical protein PBT91_09875 [Zunongwangia sp. HGR-M22]
MKKKNKGIQDDEQYAILKRNGMSEEKASEVSENKEQVQRNVYHDYTYKELIVVCRQRGITLLEKKNKEDIIDLIIKNDQ